MLRNELLYCAKNVYSVFAVSITIGIKNLFAHNSRILLQKNICTINQITYSQINILKIYYASVTIKHITECHSLILTHVCFYLYIVLIRFQDWLWKGSAFVTTRFSSTAVKMLENFDDYYLYL